MASGYSFHFGLNRLDPTHYAGWNGALDGCERDAAAMNGICRQSGFQGEMLLNEAATRNSLLGRLRNFASALRAGDTLVVTFAGHGSQLPDANQDELSDRADETWCLFDGMLLDDELGRAWSTFRPGVRIVLISDSCHSGSVLWSVELGVRPEWLDSANPIRPRHRAMPDGLWRDVYLQNQTFYDAIMAAPLPASPQCTVAQISACQDNQITIDEPTGGKFTRMLMQVWNNGQFQGGYPDFTKAIRRKLPLANSPNFEVLGAPNEPFVRGQVFSRV